MKKFVQWTKMEKLQGIYIVNSKNKTLRRRIPRTSKFLSRKTRQGRFARVGGQQGKSGKEYHQYSQRNVVEEKKC